MDGTPDSKMDGIEKNGELQFIRFTQPAMMATIPLDLFRQIEQFNMECIGLLYQGLFIQNPLVWFVAMKDEQDDIKGFFWAIVSLFEKRIILYAVSIDKKHQEYKSRLQDRIIDYLFNLPIKEEYKQKIVCETTKMDVLKRCGWKQSENVLMEIIKENKNELSL